MLRPGLLPIAEVKEVMRQLLQATLPRAPVKGSLGSRGLGVHLEKVCRIITLNPKP